MYYVFYRRTQGKLKGITSVDGRYTAVQLNKIKRQLEQEHKCKIIVKEYY